MSTRKSGESMNEWSDADLDAALQQALDVEPSPGFVGRVRLGCHEAPRPSAWVWPLRIGAALATAGAAASLVFIVAGGGVSPSDVPTGRAPTVSRRATDANPDVRLPGAGGEPSTSMSLQPPPRRPADLTRRSAASGVPPVAAVAAQPAVDRTPQRSVIALPPILVFEPQVRALRALLAGSSPVTLPPAASREPSEETLANASDSPAAPEPVVVPPLEIAPIPEITLALAEGDLP